ncbi:RluA family pseudouridine synthase [Ancylobacter dichloromethanicus]|uniref:Pseudouridine synthase n=1 Tax=Ancylobacter dichloromethanicus TaxID=518825 RepID=A0A9W6JEY4_9HYPH|nr:RluA family pseudouridine synthase [Ancylobacter dichloromethanicus]MBS7553069.1 RluA family pseudouridine synthase [Ancylobacter dichloromethanicus]GLK74585.1 pseudouridine synthase [Ancylobacter dichloromethanicus]
MPAPDELNEDLDDVLPVAGATRVDITVGPEDEGLRLDRVLARHLPELSRTRLQALIAEGRVQRAGLAVPGGSAKAVVGESYSVEVPAPEAAEPAAQDIPLTIVHEDDHLIVIDKPAGMVVHPAPGNADGTLVNALLFHCGASLSGIGGVKRPGIVHRLDKDTSGLIVVAKNDRAHKRLAAQFADHGRTGPLERAYLAFVWGEPDLPSGTVDAPLARHPIARERIAVRTGGRFAITHWQRLEAYADTQGRPIAALVECQLETGRTHQIRVHMAHVGHPLLGDAIYSGGQRTRASRLGGAARTALEALGRQALHAARLGFEHPATGEFLLFESALPADLARLRAALAAGD